MYFSWPWLPIFETAKSEPPHAINGQTKTNNKAHKDDGENEMMKFEFGFFIFIIIIAAQIFGIICPIFKVFFRETERNFGHLFWFLDNLIVVVIMSLAFQSFFRMPFRWSIGYGLGPNIGFIFGNFDFGYFLQRLLINGPNKLWFCYGVFSNAPKKIIKK